MPDPFWSREDLPSAKKEGAACHLQMFTHTHTKKKNLRLHFRLSHRERGREEGFSKFSFYYPGQKKKNHPRDLRREERCSTCDIMLDQARSAQGKSDPRLSATFALRWSRLIEPDITRGTAFFSPRISRMVLFFFLSRAVDYHQTKTLNNADNFFLSKSLSTRLGTKPRGTQVCPCNTYTPRAPSACASKPLYPQNGGVGVWAIHGIWWIRTLNNAWKCADIFCAATLRQDFRCRVLSQGSGTIVLAHFQVLSRVCNAMHLDFLKAAYYILAEQPELCSWKPLLLLYIVIAHLGVNVLCGFFSKKTRSDSIKAGFAKFQLFFWPFHSAQFLDSK